MTDARTRIAAGLERAFAAHGFAEPNVETLRDASGVSLRTLYKYLPSRDAMVGAALEHRHQRFIDRVFGDLPRDPSEALAAIIDRIAGWMAEEAAHGCLFHAAVAAAPNDARLRALLARHKEEVVRRAADVAGLPGCEDDLMLILDGLTQSWPLRRDRAVASAKRLCATLLKVDPPPASGRRAGTWTRSYS